MGVVNQTWPKFGRAEESSALLQVGARVFDHVALLKKLNWRSLLKKTFSALVALPFLAVQVQNLSADPAPNVSNFSLTAAGSINTTVPDGTCAAVISVTGANGGSSSVGGTTGGYGGGGAIIGARFSVLPLQAVGGSIGQGGQLPNGGTGYSIGGVGGTAQGHRGAGGGGSTGLTVAGMPLVVAGGGGGGGAAHTAPPVSHGGDGGFSGIAAGTAAAGSNGSNGFDGAASVGGGEGGQAAAPGVGGVLTPNTAPSSNGFPGVGGNGGNGGNDATWDSAGGGGGGYFGGGGGASTTNSSVSGAGGGGGSSFVRANSPTAAGTIPSAITGSARAKNAAGSVVGVNGSALIDWVPCQYRLDISKSASPSPVRAGDATTWTVSVTNNGPDPMTRGDTVSLADTLPVGPNGANTPVYRVLSVSTNGGSDANLDRTPFSCAGVTVGAALPTNTTCSRPYAASTSPGAPSGGVRGLDVGETLTITYEQVISNTAICSTITNRASTVDRASLSGTTDIVGSNSARSIDAPLNIQCYDLGINKSVAPTSPNNNDTITWSVVVTNNGAADMEGPVDTAANPLIVTDVAPTGSVSAPTSFTSSGPAGACTYSGGTITCPSSLPAGQSQTFTFQQTVNSSTTGGTAINNSASITDPATGDSNDSSTTTSTVASNPSIGLVKTAGAITDLDGNGPDVGDTVSYTFAVTNTGNVALTNVTVTDPLVTVAGGPIASLAPAATDSATFTATYTLTQANIDAGGVSNQATATGTPPSGPAVTDLSDANTAGSGPGNTDPTVLPIPSNPSIGLVKTAGTITDLDANGPDAGDTVNYTFTVLNTGNVTLTNVTVTDPLVTVAGGPIASLAPGTSNSTTFTATYTLTQANVDAGGVTNQATATGTPPTGPAVTDISDANTAGSGLGNGDPTVTPIPSNPSIGLVKTAGAITDLDGNGPDAGDLVNYTFTVTNTGNVTLTNITVTDPLVTVTGGPLASLAPGASNAAVFAATYTLTQANVDAGGVTNQATATGNPPTGPPVTDLSDANTAGSGPGNTDPTVTPIPANPSLTIDKTTSTASYDAVGDTITYSYLLTNTGNVTLTGPVAVSDNKTTVTCLPLPPGGIAPGATHTCSATYTVIQADLNQGNVINTASGTITSPTYGAVTTPTDQVTVPAVQSPAMSVVKNATIINFTNIGDLITYEYIVTNTGNVALTSPITVTDNRVTPVNCPALPPGGLAPGANITCTGVYTVLVEDLDIGTITNLASASSGPISSPQTSETVPTGATPALTISKASTSTTFATVGQTIPYSFTVTNTGGATITRVVNVTDNKIGTIACFTPVAGDLTFTPAETVTCSANYTITQADLDAGFVTNQAFASTTYGAASIPITSPPDDLTINAGQTPSLNVTKSAATLPAATVGQVLTYTIAVQNTGNVTISSITVTDPLIPSLSCPIASLAPGASNNTCTGSYTVTQANVNAGVINNTATASGITPQGAPVSDTGSLSLPVAQTPAIGLVKTAGTITDVDGNGPDVGDTVAYAFTVTNTGNVTLTNITVTDPLVTVAGGPIASLLPSLSNSTTFTATYTLTQANIDAGGVTNQATASGTPPSGPAVTDVSDANTAGSGPGNNDPTVTPIPATPSISLIKTAGAVTDVDGNGHDVGDTITYAFTVTNTGNVTLTNVTVTDPLVTVVGGPISSLAPAASNSSTFTATYTLTQADVDAGGVTNQATASGTPPTGPAVTDVSDTATNGSGPGNDDPTVVGLTPSPSIGLVKTAGTITDLDGNGPDVGDTIAYAFVVTNTGNVTLTNVTVTDPLITVVGGPLASLAPTASDNATFTATYTLTQADVDAGGVNNQATASGTPPSGPAVTDVSDANTTGSGPGNDDPTVTPIPSSPSIGLVKSAGAVTDSNSSGRPDAGDTVNYTFTVTNTGNVTLTNVTVTDPLVAVVGGPVASLAPGASNSTTFTASYVLTQANVDAGGVNNQATASGTPPTGPAVTDLSDANTPGSGPGNDDPTVTTIPTSASISLVKTAGAITDLDGNGPDAGDTVAYAFTVTNTGVVVLTNVTVTDPLVAVVGGPVASLAPGASNSTTFTASYVLTQADVDAGGVNNQATASGTPPSGPAVTDVSDATTPGSGPGNDDPTSTPVPSNPSIGLVKTAGAITDLDGNGPDAGDTVAYAFTVTNTGNVTLSNVTVTDPLVTVAGGPVASLAPGASNSTTFTASYVLTQADVDAGGVNNQATASGTPPSGPAVTDVSDATTPGSGPGNDDPTSTPVPSNPSIGLVKTAGAITDLDGNGPDAGDTVNYTLTATNTGNVTLSNVTVTDPLVQSASLVPSANTSLSMIAAVQPRNNADLRKLIANNSGSNVLQTASLALPVPGQADANLITAAIDTIVVPPSLPTSLHVSRQLVRIDSGHSPLKSGDTVAIAFTLINNGDGPLTTLKVQQVFGERFVDSIDYLAPNALSKQTIVFFYTLRGEDLYYGAITAPATVSFKTRDQVQSVMSDLPLVLEKTKSLDELLTASILPASIPSLSPGVSTVFTGTYTLTQADMDAGLVTNTAQATGITPAGGSTSDTSDESTNGSGPGLDDPTVIALAQSGSIDLVKTAGSPTANLGTNSGLTDAGDTVAYSFVVTNTGNVTLTSISINDPKVGPVTCTPATIAPATVANCSATYVIQQSDLDAGEITNTATVTGSTPSGSTVTDVSGTSSGNNNPTVTPLTPSPAVTLVKTAAAATTSGGSHPVLTDAGDTIAYSFLVTNTGNVTLTSIGVSDPKVGAVTCPITTLAPAASTTCTGTYSIQQLDIDLGSITNTATAVGSPPTGAAVNDVSGTLGTNDDPTVSALPQNPVIGLVKTAGDIVDVDGNGPDAGDTIAYTFTVENLGNTTLLNITVTDPLVTVTGGPLASLLPGATDTATFSATYELTQDDVNAGKFENTAEASGTPPVTPTNPSPTPATDQSDDDSTAPGAQDPTIVDIPQNPGIGLVKLSSGIIDEDGNGPDVGDRIDYSFQVTNTGNVTLTNIRVTDQNPVINVLGGPLASLEPTIMDATTFRASYTLTQADIDRGQFENTATATGTPPIGSDTSDRSDDTSPGSGSGLDDPTVTSITQTPDIRLVKIAAEPTVAAGVNPNLVDAGDATRPADTITYTFEVYNRGNITLRNITIDDPLLGGLLPNGPIPQLLPGASDTVTYSATYSILPTDMVAGGVTNTAIASGEYNDRDNIPRTETDTSGTTEDNDTPTAVAIVLEPGIALVKDGEFNDLIQPPEGANLNDAIDYTFVISNTGNLPITGVTLTDPLPGLGAISCSPALSATLAVGGTVTCTAQLLLTQDHLNAGQVVNQATVSGTAADGTPVSDLSGSAANNDNPTGTSFPLPPVTLTKSASVATAAIGDRITYTIRATDVQQQPVEVVDLLPPGLTYVPGSVTVNSPAATASIAGRTLTVGNIFPQGAQREVLITLQAVVNTSAKNGTLTNRARLFFNGQLLGEATAKVEIRPEPVFDCGDIVGKVFDDANGNGTQDAATSPYEPERGLPGVRVVTAKGELITTDKHGRFHIACADIPDGKIGSNFILKVDPRSLPSGYRLTTENPKVIRLTKGKMSKVNFGASISRVIRFNLSDKAFGAGQTALPEKLRAAVAKIVSVMEEEPSVLRLQYQIGSSGKAIAQRRLEQAEAYIREEWGRVHGRAKLPIETRLLKLQQESLN